MGTEIREIATPLGPARIRLVPPATGARGRAPRGTLVLGHGAGGGTQAADLQAVTAAATGRDWQVVLVDQPWRVAGRRVAPRPAQLDVGWLAVLAELAPTGPLVLGGRSAGARVACRTASALGAAGVVCLAFPLHPPGRPERSRVAELALPECPVLVVQGERDPFGGPAEVTAAIAAEAAAGAGRVTVVAVPGDHALRSTAPVAAAVAGWLAGIGAGRRRAGSRPRS